MSVGECLVGAYRIRKEQRVTDQTNTASDGPTANDYHWILVSDTHLDQTHEFDPILRPIVTNIRPLGSRSSSSNPGGIHQHGSQSRSIATPPRLIPERIQTYNPHIKRGPNTAFLPPGARDQRIPPVSNVPSWLQELLSFRRRPNELPETKMKEELAQVHIPDKAKLKRSQDLLTLTLLKAIYLLKAKGEVRGKLLLSRQSPNNELKQLVFSATALAQETFEMLPPFVACISPEDLDNRSGHSSQAVTLTKPTSSSTQQNGGSHSLPHSTITLRPDPISNINKTTAVAAAAYSLPASNELMDGFQLVDQDLLLESTAPSAPPHGAGLMLGKVDRAMAAAASIVNNHHFAYGIGNHNGTFDHCLSHRSTATGGGDMTTAASLYRTSTSNSPPEDHPSVAPAGVFCPPLGSTPYGLPFSGVFGSSGGNPDTSSVSLNGRRQSSNKTLFDGDRPLTPPAQGWYAKYSSGVTGVVWDRVHQAWVVSWTLAGKRTFRHFTCKSFGGFDKAREAAIEFRLARNRDIAAYNKRCKDRR